ncbi:MAG: peptidyl-prolyl cis-trans isomerase [Deltaproteobacteria bacterium]|nr:peptidyl-prolyl cis-trans isomerase [Deltaproteobacteria bacterium]
MNTHLSFTNTSKSPLWNAALAVMTIMTSAVSISAAQANTDAAVSKAETKTEKKAEKKDNAKAGAKKMTTVVIETSLGNIEVELNAEKAPISTENFLKYVDKKHYDGTIFHRVISNFMIQGGGMTEKMDEKKSDAPIKNEAANGLKNDRGTLAMARTSVVDSATAQFFINVQDNDFLNHKAPNPREFGYAVFGKVTAGMDVVDKIKAVPTGMTGGMQDVPKTPVVMKSVRRK